MTATEQELQQHENDLLRRETLLAEHNTINAEANDIELRINRRRQQYYPDTMHAANIRYQKLYDPEASKKLRALLMGVVFRNSLDISGDN